MKLFDAITAELSGDRDSYTLPDGAVVRLSITPDDGDPFDDSDTWGRVAPVKPHRYTVHNAPRPAGFDGNAEIVDGRSDRYWWQPPADGPTRADAEAWRKMRYRIADLLEYGLKVVTLEVCRGYDAYGRLIVVDVAVLGGVDLFAGDAESTAYLADIIRDLLSELSIEDREIEA